MLTRRVRLRAGWIGVALSLALGGTAAAQTGDHPKEKPLVAAADVGFAPFSYKTTAGELTGFSVEFGREIARRLGRPSLEVIDQKFSVIFAGLFAKRYEMIIAPTNITAERAEQMLFSEPYMATGLGFLIRQGEEMKGLDDLKGKAVAVNNGSISDTWATENAAKYGFEVQRYDKNADAVQGVLTQRAFANISEVPTVAYIATQQKALKVGFNHYTGRSFGLVFRKDDVEFRNEVEKIVEAILASHENRFHQTVVNDNFGTGLVGGYFLDGSHDNTISSSVVNQNVCFGILLAGSSRNHITGNTVNGSSCTGSNPGGNIVLRGDSDQNVIHNNEASGSPDGDGINTGCLGGCGATGLPSTGADDNVVSHNTANNNARYGIAQNPGNTGNVFSNNTTTGNGVADFVP